MSTASASGAFSATPVAQALLHDPHASLMWRSGSAIGGRALEPTSAVPVPSYMVQALDSYEIPRQSKYQAAPKDALPWAGPQDIGRGYKPEYHNHSLSRRIGHHTSCKGSSGLIHTSVAVSLRVSPQDAAPLTFNRYTSIEGRPDSFRTFGLTHPGTLGGPGTPLTHTAVLLPPVRAHLAEGQETDEARDVFYSGKRLVRSMQRLALAEHRVKEEAFDSEARAQRYWLGKFLQERAGKMESPKTAKTRAARAARETAAFEASQRLPPVSPMAANATMAAALGPRCSYRDGPHHWSSYQEYPGSPSSRAYGQVIGGPIRTGMGGMRMTYSAPAYAPGGVLQQGPL